MILVWFRNDLRIHDNTALIKASAASASLLALYLDCPQQDALHDVAERKSVFKQGCLNKLGVALDARGIALASIEVGLYNDVAACLLEYCLRHKVDTVYANREYGANEIARDKACAALLRANGITLRLPHDQSIVAPDKILTQQGKPYTVFTPFYNNWRQQLPVPTPIAPTAEDDVLDNQAWPPGEQAGLARLARFLSGAVNHYAEQRDVPSVAATSGLSPYLAVGAVSARVCLWRAQHLASAETQGVETWIKELAWRDFYIYILFHFPRVSKHRAFQPLTENLPWRQDEAQFDRWCQGQTGIPIIDAAMRQLVQTGWMHNRLRMVTAMFLTKHLLIDWRKGERFFMRHLIDGHLASNNGGWQWAASTGTDAAPYFRIFNPVRQSERFDPEGTFIRQYVPELATLPNKSIHLPSDRERAMLAIPYPAPMVDLAVARDRAIASFKAIKHDHK